MKETIHIYHTNDLHSHFENWPRIRRFLQERRKWHEEAGESVFIFDIGDHVDRSHPMTEGSLGKRNVELLNEAGYDAVTIGNNEGITLPKEGLEILYEEAEFPIVLANLYEEDGKRPEWAQPFCLVHLPNGMTMGLTGATAFFSGAYEQLGWTLSEPLAALKEQVDQISGQADIVVVLSHLGIYEDEKIAHTMPKADVVLGAHTHHLLHEGKEINQTLLAAAGRFGYYVGHVMIEVDTETKQILRKKACVYNTMEALPAPANEHKEIEGYAEEGKKALAQPVISLSVPLASDWFAPSELPQLLCEALREWCGADGALLNAGVCLGGLEAGTVTKYDIHRMLPHPINPCLIELSGAELKEVLKQTTDDKWPHMTIKGLGFRGKVMGRFIYDRLSVDMEQYRFKVNSVDIVNDHQYKLATLDMFAYGRFFPPLYRAPQKKHFMPEFLRDVMEWKLLHHGFHLKK
ncbi:bifunctional metallophosphatase/5'-nucleotidase [Pseudobacillus badius]|uniref:bifunctional metallophosphatase/5'-nucleotidase n=1 Tax=Bacillus badius TaxID=1455 RepID=UPI0024A43780|nr:bifunctional UDP-sugar hydrolase/5'-nucleotidase [Bacillus badius]GLY09542.1 putative metallophosphoesterase YunD [Bacillus badius]